MKKNTCNVEKSGTFLRKRRKFIKKVVILHEKSHVFKKKSYDFFFQVIMLHENVSQRNKKL